jgi:hypothetical protein
MSIKKGAFGGNSTWGLSTFKQIKAAHWQIDTLAKLPHISQRGRKKMLERAGNGSMSEDIHLPLT